MNNPSIFDPVLAAAPVAQPLAGPAPSSPLQLRVDPRAYELPSVADLLVHHAERSPDKVCFNFIDYAGEEPVDMPLTHARLFDRARQIAALLQTRCQQGDRVLLLFPAGLDYLCAFFGCLYAGMIAVPAYPPNNPRLAARLAAVARDSGASLALTTTAELHEFGPRSAMAAPLSELHWLATDTELAGWEHMATRPVLGRSNLAFLQYTSGSTGIPKGVMVTHGNLLANLHAIALHMQFCETDRHLSWLPPYHDMGMIGAMLGSFAAGVRLDFMMPMAFLRKPERWLREISRRRITLSGAPNFAYELCLSKVPDRVLDSLDLSSWQLAYSGAEPVREATLRRFAERFAPTGFDAKAFYPCYGMAETTLFVTGTVRGQGAAALHVDHDAYALRRQAQAPGAGSRTQALMGCGEVAQAHQLVIAHPETLNLCAPGEVGEILVSGPSVTAGYWERPEETRATFGVKLLGSELTFLRTGDLGFLMKGQLHVSGRVKDTIVVRGINLHPHDIEASVDLCHEAIRQGCGIAFSVESEGAEKLVFVQEIGKRDLDRAPEIFSSIQKSIVDNHEVQPWAIALIESGKIPKTTSGKLSRRPCKEQFLTQTLQVVTSWTNPLHGAAGHLAPLAASRAAASAH
jgi:acyl-CoA synthetase (AMP-forming)/AMP-acid ligase II